MSNSGERSRSSSNASSNHGRPLPVLPSDATVPVNEKMDGENPVSDNYTGLPHTPTHSMLTLLLSVGRGL